MISTPLGHARRVSARWEGWGRRLVFCRSRSTRRLGAFFGFLFDPLDERQRRLLAGATAELLGRGGTGVGDEPEYGDRRDDCGSGR